MSARVMPHGLRFGARDDRAFIPRTVRAARRYVETHETRWQSERAHELEAVAELRVRAAFVADCLSGGPPNTREQAAQAPLAWLLWLATNGGAP